MIRCQGELVIIPVSSIPAEAKLQTDKQRIVAHSETGHHHVMDVPAETKYYTLSDMVDFVETREPVQIRHLRGWDTHETVELPSGTYKIIRTREWTSEGERLARD